jgi:hypothetical protein
MKTHGGVGVEVHIFLTSTLVGGEWFASSLGHFTQRKKPRWVGPGTGPEDVEKTKILPLRGLGPFGRPSRSQSRVPMQRNAQNRKLELAHAVTQATICSLFIWQEEIT